MFPLPKSFIVKSTPQIIEIIDSVCEIEKCEDRSQLVHQVLLPYILNVIESDKTQITDIEGAGKEIRGLFDSYYQSI